MKLSILIVLMLESMIHRSACATECPDNVLGRNDHFYIFSDKQATAVNALMVCDNAGGSLVQSNDAILKADLIEQATSVYIPEGLVLIRIYASPSNHLWFKYRPIDSDLMTGDTYSINDWSIPELGRLRSIRLYESSTGQFTKLVEFCYRNGNGDRLRQGVIDCSGENPAYPINFGVYGGRNYTENSIIIYNYNTIAAPIASNLFLDDEDNFAIYRESSRNGLNFMVYIPDISVFTGARSDVHQSNWFWDGETMIAGDSNYPPPNTSVCQQMTWPLTYDDGINLHPKLCSDEAYYICQIKFDIFVSHIACNGSVLEITWNLTNIYAITQDAGNLVVQFSVDGARLSPKLNIANETRFVVNGLQQRTTYFIEAIVTSDNCDQFNVSTSSIATTSYGKPGPVTNAHTLSNMTSDCVIEWDHNSTDTNILSYTIYINNENEISEIQIPSTAMQNSTTARHNVNLLSYPYNTRAMFQIQAFSCEGGSALSGVRGFCILEPPSTTPTADSLNTSDIITIVVPSVAAVLVILIIIGIIRFYHKRKYPETGSTDHQPNPVKSNQTAGDDLQLRHVQSHDKVHQLEGDYVNVNDVTNASRQVYVNQAEFQSDVMSTPARRNFPKYENVNVKSENVYEKV